MSILGVLGNGRGRRLPASATVPRSSLEPLPTDRLAADRLSEWCNDYEAPITALPQLADWLPQRTPEATLPPPDPRARGSALDGPEPVGSAQVIPTPVVPHAGRHRRPASPKLAILNVPVALRGVQTRSRRLA